MCVVISVLGDRLVGAYLHMRGIKDLWDARESKLRTINVSGEWHVIDVGKRSMQF